MNQIKAARGEQLRAELLKWLGQGPASTSDLVAWTGATRPVVRYELHKLKAAGKVTEQRIRQHSGWELA